MKQILLKYLEANYNSQCPYTYIELHRMIMQGVITSRPQLVDDLKVL
jgi:hypothetical protein